MPSILRYKGYTFFFYSSEGVPREPVHVHVRGHGGVAKIWIEPQVMAAGSSGIPAKALRELIRVAGGNRDYFIDRWKEYFDD
jgi:hypothetical protein